MYEELRLLQEDNGTFGDLAKYLPNRNAQYTSTTFVAEALHSIASILWEQDQELLSGKDIGLMCDETTDKSITEQLDIMYRFLDGAGGVKVHSSANCL